MKKIILWIMIFVLSDTQLMHGMTPLRGRLNRLPTAIKTAPVTNKTLPPKQPTPPTSPDISSAQPLQPKLEVSPFLNQKKLLSGLTIAAQSKVSALSQYVRNWFNNVMASWFSTPSAVTKPIAIPESQKLIVSGVSNAPSPFATGIQKRQYSAIFERQPATFAEEKIPMEKSAVQMESDALIQQLSRSRNKIDAHLTEQIRLFFKQNSIDDIQALFTFLVDYYTFYDLGFDLSQFVDEHDQATVLKIEDVKQKILKDMGWPNDLGSVEFLT